MFMRIELDKSKATVGLHTNFGKIADGLKERDEVRLGAIWDEIADIDRRVIRWRLLYDRFVRQRSTLEVDGGRSVASPTRTRRRHGTNSTTLGLLVGPIDTDSTRTEPFTVHGRNGLLSISLIPECKEPISTRLSRVHVPHDTGIGHGAKGTKGFGQYVVVDLGAKITDEDMVVAGRVFLVLLALVGPVDTDLLGGSQ